MKTIKITLTSIVALAAFGLIFSLSKCKKEVQVVPVTVHDTIKGKSISGSCTYPDYTGAMVAAKGAVISLYLGSSVSGSPVATTTSDASGNYTLPYLLPNTYYLYAVYNTANANYKPINGIEFKTDATDPTYAVTMGSSNLSKNLVLAVEAPSGTRILTITVADTAGSMGTKKYVPFESHSKCEWWAEYSGAGYDGGINGTTLQGGFSTNGNNANGYGWGLTTFYFDEANPANTVIKGYAQLSHINTFESVRDTLYSGCVPKTLQVDTSGSTRATCLPVPKTDTAWYYAPAGSVVKYGKGYLAHGYMTAFYKSAAGEIEPPRVTACTIDSANAWNGKGPGYQGPYGQKITKQIDMYFEFQGVNTAWNATHTTYNKYAVFEGQFDFNRSDYYVKTTSIGNTIHVTPHVQLKGANNFNF
ncbi:MAG: carboxypeptidase regulatory-like domain-containing protein [Bacteroidetes bacterium]|nr:carboxypeptidase regulatory-like domain-containing protein [Bacteroidota bacterium]